MLFFKIETIKIENNTKIKFIKEPVKGEFIFVTENK